MKVILISIFQAVAAKNILRTNVITSLLASPGVRVVCLVKNEERAEYYRREVPHERLSFVAFYISPWGFWERFFGALKFHTIRTKTTDLRRRMAYEESGRGFIYRAGLFLNRLLANRLVRGIARFFDYRLVRDCGYCSILEKIRPDVVVLPHLFDDVEISLLREAKRKNIPTIGFINSWDKLTARSAIRILPDWLAVFNDIVKREAMEHADMPEGRIRIVGIPQYDQYVASNPESRGEFCRKNNLDAHKKIILFCPLGSSFADADWGMIDLLHEIIDQQKIFPTAQLFIRFQPNDFFAADEIAERPWLKYNYPGTRYGTERGGDWDMNFEELRNLTATLNAIDLLVCYASSMSVDAAVFDRPVINIDFEITPSRNLAASPLRFYDMEHYAHAVATDGIKRVQSKEEMIEWMKRYLENPKLGAEGRKRLVREQAGEMDGKAGERMAAAIVSVLA